MGILEKIQQQQFEETLESAEERAERARRNANEASAFYQFFRVHPDLVLDANEEVLRQYVHDNLGKITLGTLEQALPNVLHRLVLKEPVKPEPTNEELIAAENKRLKSLSIDELRADIRRGMPKPIEREINLPYSFDDIKQMTGEKLRKLIYNEDGTLRENGAYKREIERILNSGRKPVFTV